MSPKTSLKKNIWIRVGWKDVNKGFFTELKRIAATKQRVTEEADHIAAEGAAMKFKVKARIEQEGNTIEKNMMVERAEKIGAATVARSAS